jgi:pimeloyl-ACP methyl ester carboxylesterase
MMPAIEANGIQIEYNVFGDPSKPAVLLIAGLAAQLPCWNDEFCNALANRGFYAIRYDNRDVGLSSRIEGLTADELMQKIGVLFAGEQTSVPYGIEDMAADGAGLLDALDIKKAHIVGTSMGGYIAQTICLNHPDHVSSLTSIYSHTGNRTAFMPTQEVMEVLLTPSPDDRAGYVDHMTRLLRVIFGSGLPFDEEFHRELVGSYYDRGFYPEGVIRHYLAIMTQKDRTADLSRITVPTMVVHGDDDPMVPLAGGEATAAAIPNATLKVFKGMGHVMPNLNAYWADILDELVEHMKAAR